MKKIILKDPSGETIFQANSRNDGELEQNIFLAHAIVMARADSDFSHYNVETIDITTEEYYSNVSYGFIASVLTPENNSRDIVCIGFISKSERVEMMDSLIEQHEGRVVFKMTEEFIE